MSHPTIYKIDSKGKVREWRMEVNGDQYRTIAGLQEGKQVTSGWTTAVGKNIGSSNEKTPEEQAVLEVESQYKKKLKSKYHKTIDTVKQGSHFFMPMLANKWDKRKDKIKYATESVFVQPKLDGIRCVFTKDGPHSRTGTPIVTIPHITKLLEPVFAKYPDAIFDGELYNHAMKENFNGIVSMVRQGKPTTADFDLSARMAEYHVYDFPGLLDSSFSERYGRLVELHDEFDLNGSMIVVVPTTQVETEQGVDHAYDEYLADGYEGGMVRLNTPYKENGRSNGLLKRKEMQDAEFTIVRIEEGRGNWAGVAKKVFVQNDLVDEEIGAGLKGSKAYAKHVLDNAASYIGKQATIQFFGRTADKSLRFPIAKVLHKDKRW